MIKEFRDFLMRGNLVELAVAFVMGLAFAALISSFVDDLIMPIIAMIFGEPDFSGLTFTINDAVFRYGAFTHGADHVHHHGGGDLLLRRQADERAHGPDEQAGRGRGHGRGAAPPGLLAALRSRPSASTRTEPPPRPGRGGGPRPGRRSGSRRAATRTGARRPPHARRCLRGVAVDPRRERRERDSAAAELDRDLERAAVGRGEELRLPRLSPAPDRPDGVDHVSCRQRARAGRLRIAGRAAAEPGALVERSRPRRHGGSRRRRRRLVRAPRSPRSRSRRRAAP